MNVQFLPDMTTRCGPMLFCRRRLLQVHPTTPSASLIGRQFARLRTSAVVMASSSPGARAPAGSGHTNRLAAEHSPYLLQHAHNPVDWYPWSPEALQKAKQEGKPIFLSVGYATCHWCHVMERESFEDEETADIMNKHFVNIKVDREERPDVDRVYMSYVQATSGRGGWPMSVWLTPELEPIYGGTYYPKKDMFQGGELAMPSFQTVLRRIASLWGTNREDLQLKSADMMSRLQQALAESVGTEAGAPVEQGAARHALLTCEEQLRKRFDSLLGGFGGAPKFPRPSEIEVLLHAHLWHMSQGEAKEAAEALHMATFSLDKMADGGMYDHIGGGFHRYSVDEYWHVPHFEKMLYDGPQLASVYLTAFQLTGEQRYARVARGILDYLRRDMTHPEGGLFSAEDADSLDSADNTKKEGAFYLWTYEEVYAALGTQKAPIFCKVYNIKPEGNCTLSSASDPHHEFGGKNVPIILKPLKQLALELGMPEDNLEAVLADCRKQLHAIRAKRPRPGLDDKVVTAWNGMAISALAVASRALAAETTPCPPLFPVDGCPPGTYMEAALKAARFVRANLYDEGSGTLRRSFRNGASAVPGFADDYANMVAGCLDLYECGGGLEWLQWACQLQTTMEQLFRDPVKGGYFSTTGADPSIKIRIKDDYDGAEPTASSVAALNLFRLSALVPEAPEASHQGSAMKGAGEEVSGLPAAGSGGSYGEKAHHVLSAFQDRLANLPMGVPKLCCAAHMLLKEPLRQVIVAGKLASPEVAALLNAAHSRFAPDKAVVLLDLEDAASVQFFEGHNPEAVAMVRRHFEKEGGHAGATAFICQNYTCQAPTTDAGKVSELLKPQGPSKPKPMAWP